MARLRGAAGRAGSGTKKMGGPSLPIEMVELTGKTRVYAVFGCPVEHSLSPAMHNAAIAALGLDCVYVPLRVEPADLPAAIGGVRAMGLAGVNLTIPLKEAAVALVDELSDEAREIGAVNTLFWKDGALCGHSTDGEGFWMSLEGTPGQSAKRALVLGAGGASRAVCFALARRGIEVTIANRTPERARELAAALPGSHAHGMPAEPEDLARAAAAADLIVNCTSVGMSPNDSESPLAENCIERGHIVCDLIYNPRETLLLRTAREKGALGLNGVDMLVNQGALSFQLWTGIMPPVQVMKAAVTGAL